MLGILCGIKRFPMRDAATVPTANSPECAIALDIIVCILRVIMNMNTAKFVVGPHRAEAAANRAIAARSFLGLKRQA